MNKTMNHWMKKASAYQQIRLASLADTSRSYLYQIASGERTASAGLAIRLEQAAEKLVKAGHDVPLLPRRKIAKDCKGCSV